jgi:hypothetical protein
MTLVFNLEKSGDVSHLSVGILQRIAAAIGLSIVDLLGSPTADGPTNGSLAATPPADRQEVAEVASALLTHRAGLLVATLAELLGETQGQTHTYLDVLADRLRPLGLGVAVNKAAATLVALPRARLTDDRIRAAQKQLGARAHVTRADVKMVYAVFRGAATLKGLRSNSQGHLRAGMLVNAGVIQSGPREIDPALLTPDVRYSLLLDEPEPRDGGS